ncbi:MAG: replication-associated recombination protein A [Oscillospiraceae bacterium]|nr:replication-associated recombination protein A [Oscillospiraceae bacterium]
MASPLAAELRPKTLDEVFGQEHILAEGGVLRRVVAGGTIPNMIFYGPSGVGKTTVARIIAATAGKKLCHLNGTTASTADIKDVVAQQDTIDGRNGVLLYLDEIQYLNKKQQQSLLECIENGTVTLIASTTENPYFYVYNAILSRSTVFEFKPLEPKDVEKALQRALQVVQKKEPVQAEEGALAHIARSCGGDVRKALNAFEMAWLASVGRSPRVITLQDVEAVSQRSAMRYDRDADEHYDILSALQKSVRGSDENAALHYLARLLEAGDIISPCRRLLVMASEDIGLAYPQAVSIVKSCIDSALQLGLPEARLPLAEAVILLCTAPKSNSVIEAIDAAMADVRHGNTGPIPAYLQDGHYSGAQKLGRAQGYQYPHSYPHHYVKQQYLPDAIKDRVYYRFGENKNEQAALAYRRMIKEEK